MVSLRRMKWLRSSGRYFDSDGVRIHYTEAGRGETVVLLHGFALNADLNWRRFGLSQLLARHYRVIAMDLRGHGLSDGPHDPGAYGMAMVEDVRRILDHLQVDRAHLVGYSTGGFVTLKFLTLYPDRLHTAAATGMAWREVDADARITLGKIGAALEEGGDFRPLFKELDLPTTGLKASFQLTLLGLLNDVKALAHVIRAFPDFEVSADALARNTVPTLTLAGTEDPITAGAEEMHARMACHRLIWLAGGDKLSCLKMPEYGEALLEHMGQAGNGSTSGHGH